MSQNLTTYAIGQMPQITCPDLFKMEVVDKLAADRFHRTTKTFAPTKLSLLKFCWLAVLGWHRELKSLLLKQLSFERFRQIRSICQQHPFVSFGQFREHSNVVYVGSGQLERLNHSERVDLHVQSKAIKGLIPKLFAICCDTLEKLTESGSGKPAGRDRKAVDHGNYILESPSDVLEKALFDKPQVGCMTDETYSAGQPGEVMGVKIPEKTKDVFVGVKTEDFADDFHCKYFTVSDLRLWTSGSEGSGWKEFLHKIISFAEDIYDKIIKVHFLALHRQWNSLCLLHIYSIGQRAFLLSIRDQKLVHGVNT